MQKISWHNKVVFGLSVIVIWLFCSCKAQNEIANEDFYTAQMQNGYFYSLEDATQQPDKVISLSLRKHKLKTFPPEILQMKNIERLDLSRNSLKKIPESIGDLKRLHYVNFAQNYLSELPKQMSELPLDTIIVWDNQIKAFDTAFKKTDLQYLDIRAVQMTRKQQRRIKNLFPNAKIKKDHPCNCGR